MWLLIDDIRDGYGCDVIARTPEGALACLDMRFWDAAIFDHDLGDARMSGYDVMKEALNRHTLPHQIQLVTSNPVGRDNMIALLKANGYVLHVDKVSWIKAKT